MKQTKHIFFLSFSYSRNKNKIFYLFKKIILLFFLRHSGITYTRVVTGAHQSCAAASHSVYLHKRRFIISHLK